MKGKKNKKKILHLHKLPDAKNVIIYGGINCFDITTLSIIGIVL
jgi:hypothetical protein